MYGTPPRERASNTRGRKEGSAYLGRVCLALNLVPSERPQLANQGAPLSRDPKHYTYKLWVDIYSLVNCDVANCEPIEIEASIGSEAQMGGTCLVYKPKTRSYKFKPVKMPTLLEMHLPQDLSQIPDIFIHLYTKGGRK